jgi:hypothetical protein
VKRAENNKREFSEQERTVNRAEKNRRGEVNRKIYNAKRREQYNTK